MITEQQYHELGRLGELLSVGSFKPEHFLHVSAALNFIVAERSTYESALAPQDEEVSEESQAETDSDNSGS